MNKHDIHHAPGRNDIIENRINLYSKIKNHILNYIQFDNQQMHAIQLDTNRKMQFMTSIKLLHVSAPECHPQGVQHANPGLVCWTCIPMFRWTPRGLQSGAATCTSFDTCHEMNFMICTLLWFMSAFVG
jgi:hypothetical protein